MTVTANGTFLAMMLLWSAPLSYAIIMQACDVKNHGYVESQMKLLWVAYALFPLAISLALLGVWLTRWWTSVTGTIQ